MNFDVGAVVASLEAQNEKLRAEVAELKKRIRLMVECVRSVDKFMDLGGTGRWYVSDLADLRRKLPRRSR